MRASIRFFHDLCFSLRCTLLQLTQPATTSLGQGVLSDLARTRAELMIENVLLRQQLTVLKRVVRRPAFKNMIACCWWCSPVEFGSGKQHC
jgi:hypothetical protein